MNINKIVFAILWAIIIFLIAMLVTQLNRWVQPSQTQVQRWDFNIWILDENIADFQKIVSDFKENFPDYANTTIWVETFSDKNLYYDTIISALWAWIAPDIFMLSNAEFSPLSNFISAVSPEVLSPSDFRRDFHPVFADDLIVRSEDNIDFLSWVPVWYQVPALFYNRRNFPRSSELLDWGRLNIEMLSLAEKWDTIPLALGDGATITRSDWIINSFLAQEWVKALSETQNTHTRQAFSQYRSWWMIGTQNYMDLIKKTQWDTDIEYFAEWRVAAMLGYPKDLKRIAEIGYQSNMLFVTPFPLSEWKTDAVAIDYDYFVVQKNTSNITLAENFLWYLASEKWQRMFAEIFPHYLPAHSWLAVEFEEQKVHPNFNVVYRNFLSSPTELISYSVENREMYKNWLETILQSENWFDTAFQSLKARILCSTKKYRDFTDISIQCR